MSKAVIFTLCLILSTVIHGWFLLGEADLDKQPEVKEKAIEKLAALKPVDVEVMSIPRPKPKPASKPVAKKPVEPKPQEKKPAPLPLEEKVIAKAKTEVESKGDFAGDDDGNEIPALRIDWGSSQKAGKILSVSQMKLVILESDKHINQEIVCLGDDQWQLRNFNIGAGIKYSQSIRIVDKVPAFREIASALKLKPNQHLAIMIPVSLEQQMENAKSSAAISNGLTLSQIKAFGGRFQLVNNEVVFEITLVKTRV